MKIVFLTFLELMINKSFFLSDTIIVIGFNMLLIGMCSNQDSAFTENWSSSSFLFDPAAVIIIFHPYLYVVDTFWKN